MLSYCLKCKKILSVLIQEFLELVMVEQWYYQNVLYLVIKKSKFVKNQEAKGLLSSLGLKTSLSKILLLGDVLF